ncbi:hypothetical protein ACFQ0B_49570 [Nonomuraea thailandensis]
MDHEAGASAARAGVHDAHLRGQSRQAVEDEIDLLGLHAMHLGENALFAPGRVGVEDAAVEVADGVVVVVETVVLTEQEVDRVVGLVRPVLVQGTFVGSGSRPWR